ncbi:C-C chemokine receptor type 6 [Aplochiton taeniatus]
MFYKKAKTMTDVYLLNVALADLIFVVALPLIIYNEQHDWSMGVSACKLLRGVYSINLYSGMLLLACISADRYVAIVQARRSFGVRSRTLTYSRLICFFIWALSVALSIPTIMYTERFEEENILLNNRVTLCQLQLRQDNVRSMKVLIPSLQVAIGFLVPLLIMIFCYSSIIYTLLRGQITQRHKAVRVIFAVVIVFLVCHLPYNVTLLTQTLVLFKERDCAPEQLIGKALTITRSLAYLHCCLNPILYAFIGVKFRNNFRKILEDLWCLGKKYIYSHRSSRQTSDIYVSGRRSMEESNQVKGSSFSI